MRRTKIVSIIGCLLSTSIAFAQDWQLGGNNDLPTLNNPANQTIGTNINRPLRFETNGTQRMFINDGLGANPGYIGIGLNYSAPKFPLHVVGDVTSVFPQGWNRAISVSHNGAIAFLREGAGV